MNVPFPVSVASPPHFVCGVWSSYKCANLSANACLAAYLSMLPFISDKSKTIANVNWDTVLEGSIRLLDALCGSNELQVRIREPSICCCFSHRDHSPPVLSCTHYHTNDKIGCANVTVAGDALSAPLDVYSCSLSAHCNGTLPAPGFGSPHSDSLLAMTSTLVH